MIPDCQILNENNKGIWKVDLVSASQLLNNNFVLRARRFIIPAKIHTEAGNKKIQDPKFISTLEGYINQVELEARYFFEADGIRASASVS